MCMAAHRVGWAPAEGRRGSEVDGVHIAVRDVYRLTNEEAPGSPNTPYNAKAQEEVQPYTMQSQHIDLFPRTFLSLWRWWLISLDSWRFCEESGTNIRSLPPLQYPLLFQSRVFVFKLLCSVSFFLFLRVSMSLMFMSEERLKLGDDVYVLAWTDKFC